MNRANADQSMLASADGPERNELVAIAADLACLSQRTNHLALKVERKDLALVAFGPNARLTRARRLLAIHDMRVRHFGEAASMFGDPGFDILLLIYIRSLEGRELSISAARTAGDTRSTTGLRWIGRLAERGLVCRRNDENDRRRTYAELTARAWEIMDGYFDAVQL